MGSFFSQLCDLRSNLTTKRLLNCTVTTDAMVQFSKLGIRDLFRPTNAHVLTPLRIHLFHKSEEIVVATKEHMESHLNMVSTLIHKRTYFATNKWQGFIHTHTCVCVSDKVFLVDLLRLQSKKTA